jgi:selenocysteine lyase/cysteine desulfurase
VRGPWARRIGLDPVPADRRVGHLIGLRSNIAFPASLGAQLAAAGVYVSLRGTAIRVSPHLYNTREECERLLEVLARVL